MNDQKKTAEKKKTKKYKCLVLTNFVSCCFVRETQAKAPT